jgi:signal transduction histidine kinase
VASVVLLALLLLPPIVIDSGVMQPMNFIIATTSAPVMLILVSVEWLFRLVERRGLRGSMVVSGVVSVACGAACGALSILFIRHSSFIDRFPANTPPATHDMAVGILVGVANSLFLLAVWALSVILPAATQRDHARQIEISGLKRTAQQLRTEAELIRLRGQLEPHFLLNTLNLIAGLVGSDTERARSVLVSLGDLLRDTLSEQSDVHTVAEEIHWLQRYLDVLEARHGDLLRVRWFIDAGARNAIVPRLILQPLVENAIRHGALRCKGGGTITVRVQCKDKMLECEVEDDGPGLGTSHEGAIGLDNVRKRIALHCRTGSLDLSSDQGRGTRAIVQMPYAVACSHQPEPARALRRQ